MTVVERSDISKISSVCQSSRAGILSKEGGMGKFAHPWGKYVKLSGNYIQSHRNKRNMIPLFKFS